MNRENSESFTLEDFWSAIENDNKEFIRDFLHNYAIDHRDVNKGLCLATKRGNEDIVRVILSSPKSPNLQYVDENGSAAIHYAAKIGNINIVGQLLDAGALINCYDKDYKKPLSIALRHEHADLVTYLKQKGAQTYTFESYERGHTPLHVALEHQNLRDMTALLETGKITSDVIQNCLNLAIRSSFYDGVCLLRRFGADFSFADKNGLKPIHWAASADDPNILRLFLDEGVEAETETDFTKQPIHIAAKVKHVKNVELLIKRQINIHAQDESGIAPLHRAAYGGSIEIVNLLLDAGANPNIQTAQRQWSPLVYASKLESTVIMERLLRAGGDPMLCNRYGVPVFHKCLNSLISVESMDKMLRLLMKYGAKLNFIESDGHTVLERCVFDHIGNNNDKRSTLYLLVQAGALLHPGFKSYDPESVEPSRESPLRRLVSEGHMDAAYYLIRSGWDVRNETWMFQPGKNQEENDFHEMMKRLSREVYPLLHMCRKEIRKLLLDLSGGTEILSRVDSLPLPKPLKDYLAIRENTIDLNDTT